MKFKLAQDAFEICPACKGKDSLRALSITVYCDSCGWDSSAAFVDCGAFDQLIFEYETLLAAQEAAKNRAAGRFPVREPNRIAV